MAAHLDISILQIRENPLQKIENDLRISLDKLKEQTIAQSDVGNTQKNSPTSYWNTLGSCIDGVSKECTKLSFAFSKPPFPSTQDTESLVNGLEVVVTAALATYRAFSNQEGVLLHNILRTYITNLTKALLEFITTVKCGKKDEMLKTVGIVWECCESFALLPKDNKELALKETRSCFGLVNDAITESEEYHKEWQENGCDLVHNENNSTSENLEEKHITASMGLAKVAKSLLKQVTKCLSKNAQTDDASKLKELDTITKKIKLLSPSVDDVFCGLYSESLAETQNEGLKLANLIEEILKMCRSSHFCLHEDGSWLDFLSQALNHNLKKLSELST